MQGLAPTLHPDRIGHYQVLERLGAGGMGVVFKAIDIELKRTVALKFLSEQQFDSAARDHLLREARAASALDHPNIGTVYGIEEADDGRFFMVMAFYEGETLAEKLRRGPLSREFTLNVACQIARGLQHAHTHGVVHRDIKPSNIVLTSDGVAKIVDFGLARRVGPSASTESLGVGGTLCYMSPEQVSGRLSDTRSDIWSLGVTLYQMFIGRLPFSGETVSATMLAILNSAPEAIDKLPEELQLILYRMLAKDPVARYQSCAELLQDVEKIAPRDRATTGAISKRKLHQLVRFAAWSAAPGPTTSRMIWTTSVVLVIMVIAVVVLHFWPVTNLPQHPPQTSTPDSLTAHESYAKGEEFLERRDRPGNIDRAIASFNNATQTDPNFALAYAGLGEAYWYRYALDRTSQSLEEAEKYSRRAIQSNDQLPDVHITLGRIQAEHNQRELALQEMQEALRLDPHNPNAMRGLAAVYAQIDRPAEAERLYKESITILPNSWIGYNDFGNFYFDRREYQKSAEQYRQAIELTPDNGIVHSNYALAVQELGRLDQAEIEFKKSLALAPSYRAYTMLGRLYYRQRRWADAAATIEKALPLNDSDYRLWANLALSYEWLNENEKANHAYQRELTLLQEAFRLNPDNPDVVCELGVLYSRQFEGRKAVQLLEKAIALRPRDPSILHNAAEAYDRLGDRRRALDLLQKGLENGLALDTIERNPGMRNLRRDPSYERLIASRQSSAQQ